MTFNYQNTVIEKSFIRNSFVIINKNAPIKQEWVENTIEEIVKIQKVWNHI